MRQSLLLLSLLLVFYCNGQAVWSKTYYEGKPTMLIGSILEDNGSCIVTGVVSGYPNNYARGIICNIDAAGNTINYKTVGDSTIAEYILYPDAFIKNSAGEFVFTGRSYDSLPNLIFGITNRNLDTISIFRYPKHNTYSCCGNSLVQYGNDYFIAGINMPGQGYNADISLSKIDSAGNLLWEKFYDNSIRDEANSITKLANGNLMLGCGWRTLNTLPHEYSHTWLLEVDTGGNIIRQYLDPNDSTYVAEDLLQTQDGGFIYSSQKKVFESGGDIAVTASVVKMSSAFNKEWVYTSGDYSLYTGINDMKVLPDDNIVACGQSVFYGTDTSLCGWVIKFDINTGAVIWEKHYKGINAWRTENYLYNLEVLPDGSIIAAGESRNGQITPQVGWLLKLDGNGCELENCLLGLNDNPEMASQISISPNPFINNISIILQKENLQQATFTITNVIGQPLCIQQEGNLSSTYTKTIDLSYLPNGIYFLEVVADGERIVKHLVKQ